MTSLLNNHHNEITRTVDTLHTGELDIGGRGRAGDPGGWALWIHAGDDLRDAVDNLVIAHDTDVAVWHEGQGAAAADVVGLEDDGAGLCRGDVGFGENRVNVVEIARGSLELSSAVAVPSNPSSMLVSIPGA